MYWINRFKCWLEQEKLIWTCVYPENDMMMPTRRKTAEDYAIMFKGTVAMLDEDVIDSVWSSKP